MRPGAEHRQYWNPPAPRPIAPDVPALRERFYQVILSAGYSHNAAEGILVEWFGVYLQKMPVFLRMLDEYERAGGDPE